ncbi:early nodulin-75 [Folsomia candida]|nr:early nodulin-75 [Folsomia candida]
MSLGNLSTKMHLKYSHTIFVVSLVLVLLTQQSQQSQIYHNRSQSSTQLDFGQRFFDALNSLRLKRQLFREDIPHHRPLTGNTYSQIHGFPHPGRWADGTKSKDVPNGNLPPAHSQYFDMLDGGRLGRYHTGFAVGGANSGGSSASGGDFGGGGGGGVKDVSFGNELVHHHHDDEHNNGGGTGGGGNDFGFTGFGGDHQDQYNPPPSKPPPSYEFQSGEKGLQNLNHHYGAPPQVNVQIHGNYPDNNKHRPAEEPKTFIHYHPVQYSQVLNIPETTFEPSPPPPTKHHGATSNSYGPPNHQPHPPLGIVEEGGFVPSTGISYDNVPKKPDNHHNHHQVHQIHHHHHHENPEPINPYRFDPYKIFSHHQHHPKPEEHSAPVAIPILAQFHTSKPIKFTKLKEPIHIIYRHPPPSGPPNHNEHHHHYGEPPRRPPHNFFHNFMRRPKMPLYPPQNHPDWFYNQRL